MNKHYISLIIVAFNMIYFGYNSEYNLSKELFLWICNIILFVILTNKK